MATAFVAGLVGALIGLAIALIAQSRQDDRLRQSEEWRQLAAKQERLRKEFATTLRLVYTIDADTGMYQSGPQSKDPNYAKRRAEIGALYEEARLADIRLRLEGATDVWRAVHEVVGQHQRFREALKVLDDSESSDEAKVAAKADLQSAHEAVSAIAETLHETLAEELDRLTPPGQPPEGGLRSWLEGVWVWVRT